jgi:DNA-binding NtrC family response regulator
MRCAILTTDNSPFTNPLTKKNTMNKIQILVIGRDAGILQTVVRLVNKNEQWNATGTGEDETAIELFHQHTYDLVLLGGGIASDSELKLRKIFTLQNPDIKIIQHWGGGSGLLENEIQSALENNEGGNFNIVDNPFS